MTLRMLYALNDFHRARQQAALQEITARLTGRPASLMSYEEVYRHLHASGRSDRGLEDVPLDSIVGSVGRYSDFTRSFLPRRENDEERWARVMARATEAGLDAMPPIELYRIGEAHFVLDGNHRVSVARQLGVATVRA